MSALAKVAYRPIVLAGSMLASAALHGAVFAVRRLLSTVAVHDSSSVPPVPGQLTDR